MQNAARRASLRVMFVSPRVVARYNFVTDDTFLHYMRYFVQMIDTTLGFAHITVRCHCEVD